MVQAQLIPTTILNLPVPGAMVSLSQGLTPALLKGVTVHPENPLLFDFVVDEGDINIQGETLEAESTKLIKYFLAALTVPEEEMWVNLSPFEEGHLIADGLGRTEMGRDLLAQDYILKQLMASLMYPEKGLGKEFWKRVYEKAYAQYGTTEIPLNTFNKVWIVPEKAVIYEHENTAYVVESRLKVMLEEDYASGQWSVVSDEESKLNTDHRALITNIVRDILIPEIEREVNEGETFANLRQMYHSMILAAWYKQNLRQSLLGQVYVDQAKTKGVDVDDPQVHQKIYDQYLKAFKKGVYNYIREDYDSATQQTIPRKYFSGGATMAIDHLLKTFNDDNPAVAGQFLDVMKQTLRDYDANDSQGDRIDNIQVKLYEFAEGKNIQPEDIELAAREIESLDADGARELFVGKIAHSSPVERAVDIDGEIRENLAIFVQGIESDYAQNGVPIEDIVAFINFSDNPQASLQTLETYFGPGIKSDEGLGIDVLKKRFREKRLPFR